MHYASLAISIENHIAHVQFNRPEQLNSMNLEFWQEFAPAIRELDQSGEVRVIVLSSQGKHFSAGMDLSIFANPNSARLHGDPGRSAENLRRLVLQLQQVFSVLEDVRVPVLAAIQGGCIGGALDLVAAADCRYCTQDAYFCIKETDLGMTADLGSLQRLPTILPQGIVREMAYTGAKMGADKALQHGLVNQVFNDHQSMLEQVMAIATQIAARSPLAITGCKTMLNYSRDHGVKESLDYMATWQAGMFRQEDMLKVMRAQTSQSDPTFDNLWPVTLPFSE